MSQETMNDQERLNDAKKALQKLLDRYNHHKDDKLFINNEKQACQSLIVPFIKEVLHWDTDDPSSFKVEESQAGKRIDYVVYHKPDDSHGTSQFIVEAKAPGKEIFNNAEFYKQALEYGHGKEHDFAILTNFRQAVILACKIKFRVVGETEIARIDLTTGDIGPLVYFEKEYWLSHGRNNELYSKLGNYQRQIPIDKQLLEDMKQWREIILTNLRKNGKNNFDFDDDEEFMHIEEEVQTFIDRLIFICYCEDKELQERQLKSLLHDKKERWDMKPGWLLENIRKIFETYRRVYDSDLFDKSICDSFYIDDDKLILVLESLREPKGRIGYDFKSIEADILGKTYENFIGHIQAGKKRFKEKEDIGKRKKSGIYYTPKYVVDYIVNNTVREHLKGKDFEEIKKIKILDPACGSGSFLRVAFDVLVEESEKQLKRKPTYDERKELLLNCIYGVDLDERAVAIAKLNLSLKMAAYERLPMLNENIKCGNSLVDDKNVARWKAFKWEKEFKEIMDDGGFDVVIGNPPWVRAKVSCNEEELKFLRKKYSDYFTGELNLYKMFVLGSLKRLKKKGRFSFIIPNSYLSDRDSKPLREWIFKNFVLLEIVNFSEKGTKDMFEITQATTILTVLNEKQKDDYTISISSLIDDINIFQQHKTKFFGVKKNMIMKFPDLQIPLANDLKVLALAAKLSEMKKLSEILNTKDGEVHLTKYSNLIKDENVKKYSLLVRGNHISPYFINLGIIKRKGGWMDAKTTTNFDDIIKNDRILIQQVSNMSQKKRIKGGIIPPGVYAGNSCVSISTIDNNYSLRSLLPLLNSKLLNWYFKLFSSTNHVTGREVKNLPFSDKISECNQQLEHYSNRMLTLNQQLNNEKYPDVKKKIQKEIEKTNQEIDELVYRLYSITNEEKKIIEQSFQHQ